MTVRGLEARRGARRRLARGLRGVIAAAMACGAVPAAAQVTNLGSRLITTGLPLSYDRGRNVSVVDRRRPEYDAVGVNAGGFTVYPRVQAGVGYSDNLFGSDTQQVSDGFVAIDPSVYADSNWGTNAIRMNLGAQLRRYFDNSVRNTTGYNADVTGQYDATGSLFFQANGELRRVFEERQSGGFPSSAAELVPITSAGGYVRAVFQGGRVRGAVSTDYHHLDFRDVKTLAGATIDQDLRDRAQWQTTARGELGITPEGALFVEFNYAKIDYDRRLPGGERNRDSNQYRALAGTTWDISALIRASIGIGYNRRDYLNNRFRRISGVAAEAEVEYFLTPLTTFTLNARRFIEDSDQTVGGGYQATAGSFRVDHELLRNLLLNAGVNAERDRYFEDGRSNEFITASAGARYLANRGLQLGGNIAYTKRNGQGNFPGSDFREMRALLTLTVQR